MLISIVWEVYGTIVMPTTSGLMLTCPWELEAWCKQRRHKTHSHGQCSMQPCLLALLDSSTIAAHLHRFKLQATAEPAAFQLS